MDLTIRGRAPAFKGKEWGATRTGDAVTLSRVTIRNSRLAWKRAGTARWDDRAGLWAISAPAFPDAEREAIEAQIRNAA
jgi:hypothetical protein